MNKFEQINKVLMSDLAAEDKCLLIELIVRADEDGVSWPSVQRLCKARGIKHEKNFKGADHYLPGLVTKHKRGRKNVYRINTPALEGVSEATVKLYHTKPKTNTPALEGVNTPAVAENTPAVEGANTTSNTTEDNSLAVTAGAAPSSLNDEIKKGRYSFKLKDAADLSKLKGTDPVYLIDLGITSPDTPSEAGVSEEPVETSEFDSRTGADWIAIKKQRPLTKEEQDYVTAKSRAYMAAHRPAEPEKFVGEEW